MILMILFVAKAACRITQQTRNPIFTFSHQFFVRTSLHGTGSIREYLLTANRESPDMGHLGSLTVDTVVGWRGQQHHHKSKNKVGSMKMATHLFLAYTYIIHLQASR